MVDLRADLLHNHDRMLGQVGSSRKNVSIASLTNRIIRACCCFAASGKLGQIAIDLFVEEGMEVLRF